MASIQKIAHLYDISKLKIQISVGRREVAVLSKSGEVLESCAISPDIDITTDLGKREAAFIALDKVLTERKSKDTPERLLYNPVTKQVARYSTPNTQTYSDNEEIDVPSQGVTVAVRDEVISIDSREIPKIAIDYKKLTKVLAAHREL